MNERQPSSRSPQEPADTVDVAEWISDRTRAIESKFLEISFAESVQPLATSSDCWKWWLQSLQHEMSMVGVSIDELTGAPQLSSRQILGQIEDGINSELQNLAELRVDFSDGGASFVAAGASIYVFDEAGNLASQQFSNDTMHPIPEFASFAMLAREKGAQVSSDAATDPRFNSRISGAVVAIDCDHIQMPGRCVLVMSSQSNSRGFSNDEASRLREELSQKCATLRTLLRLRFSGASAGHAGAVRFDTEAHRIDGIYAELEELYRRKRENQDDERIHELITDRFRLLRSLQEQEASRIESRFHNSLFCSPEQSAALLAQADSLIQKYADHPKSNRTTVRTHDPNAQP